MLVFGSVLLGLGGAFAAVLPLSDEAAEALARTTLAKLSLEERNSLLGGCATMYLNAIPHAGISREWAFSDCGHAMKPEHNRDRWGYVKDIDDRSTSLPCISALASTWNPELAAKHGHVMGEQMRGRNKDMMLGPGVNMLRTQLCGRNWEFMGEDPYLAAKMCVPLIRAAQEHGIAATIKHFCLNNQELDRFNVGVTVDDRTLNEIYQPVFKAAIVEGGALAVMTAYNRYNGIFCSENSYLQKAILRDRWGFKGMIVTDWGGQHSGEFAVNNGGGIEMDQGRGIVHTTDFYGSVGTNRFPIATAVREGRVPASTLDEAVLHILYTMAKTGFLTGEQTPGERLTAKHQAVAREIGEQALTLLKNDDAVLPLDRAKMKKIVLFGAFADLEVAHLGSSCENHPLYEITFMEGLREYLGEGVELVRFPLGGETGDSKLLPIDNLLLETEDTEGTDAFVERAWQFEHRRGDKVLKACTSKEAAISGRSAIQKGDRLTWTARVKAPESGDFAFLFNQGNAYSKAGVAVDGREVVALSTESAKGHVRLEKGRVYEICFTLVGACEWDSVAFGWIPPSANSVSVEKMLAESKSADAVLVFTGTSMGSGRAKETEGDDRPNMLAPSGHDEDIARILSWKLPNTVVVCRSGSAIELPWADDCRTLLHLSYLGQEAGRPFAKALFGDIDTSGRLIFSWPRRYADTGVAQCGTYAPTNVIYNERFYIGYRWFDAKEVPVLFPFGHGLSYTTFEYGEPTLSREGGLWRVRVKVTNVGHRRGAEVVQLYVHAVSPAVERAPKELKGFRKLFLDPGESAVAEFEVSPRDLAYYDEFSHRFRADAGDYTVLLGSSAANLHRQLPLALEKTEFFEP